MACYKEYSRIIRTVSTVKENMYVYIICIRITAKNPEISQNLYHTFCVFIVQLDYYSSFNSLLSLLKCMQACLIMSYEFEVSTNIKALSRFQDNVRMV